MSFVYCILAEFNRLMEDFVNKAEKQKVDYHLRNLMHADWSIFAGFFVSVFAKIIAF